MKFFLQVIITKSDRKTFMNVLKNLLHMQEWSRGGGGMKREDTNVLIINGRRIFLNGKEVKMVKNIETTTKSDSPLSIVRITFKTDLRLNNPNND